MSNRRSRAIRAPATSRNEPVERDVASSGPQGPILHIDEVGSRPATDVPRAQSGVLRNSPQRSHRYRREAGSQTVSLSSPLAPSGCVPRARDSAKVQGRPCRMGDTTGPFDPRQQGKSVSRAWSMIRTTAPKGPDGWRPLQPARLASPADWRMMAGKLSIDCPVGVPGPAGTFRSARWPRLPRGCQEGSGRRGVAPRRSAG